MKIQFTFFLLLFSFIAFGQKVDLAIKSSGQYPNYEYESQIIVMFKSKYQTSYSFNTGGNSVLNINIDISKVNQLEGMSTIYSGLAKIKFNLKNSLSKLDSNWVYSSQLKANDKYQVYSKLVDNFKNDTKGLEFLNVTIQNILKLQIQKNCEEILKLANEDFENKELKSSYIKLKGLDNSTCKKEVLELRNKISEAYSEEFCNEKLDRIKILAISGIDYKMDIAIEELLKMPSKAKCREEAILISKSIGDYLLKKPSNSEKAVKINQIFVNGQDLDNIFNN